MICWYSVDSSIDHVRMCHTLTTALIEFPLQQLIDRRVDVEWKAWGLTDPQTPVQVETPWTLQKVFEFRATQSIRVGTFRVVQVSDSGHTESIILFLRPLLYSQFLREIRRGITA